LKKRLEKWSIDRAEQPRVGAEWRESDTGGGTNGVREGEGYRRSPFIEPNSQEWERSGASLIQRGGILTQLEKG